MGTNRYAPKPGVDRRAIDLLGDRRDYVEVTVPDAWSNDGGRAVVMQSVRHDPLGRMAARRQVDAAQLAAGRRWQSDYDRAAGNLSTNFASDDPVSGGGASSDQVTDQMIDARGRVEATRAVLGFGYALVEDIIGRGMSIIEAAAVRGSTTPLELKVMGGVFRQCLEALAVYYGYAQAAHKPKQHRREPELMSDRTAVTVKNGNRVVSVSGGRWQAQRRSPGGSGPPSKTVDPWENIGAPHSEQAAAIVVASR